MERMFWLLLGKDGTSVRTIMEEFQQSHRHFLAENHQKMVPFNIYCSAEAAYPLCVQPPTNCHDVFMMCPLLAGTGSVNRHSD